MAVPTDICLPALVLPKGGGVELWNRVERERDFTTREWQRKDWAQLLVFDAADYRWPVAEAKPFDPVPILARLFSRVGYNPTLTVQLLFAAPEPSDLTELKRALAQRVEDSEDGLTQMLDRDRLKALVLAATSFADLLARLKKYRVV